MLLVGTTAHLEDLDRQYTVAEDVNVDAIAVATDGRATPATDPEVGTAYALVDGRRLARVEAFELAPLAELAEPTGQSLAAGRDHLVVGTAGAHLWSVAVGPAGTGEGRLQAVTAFDRVEGRQGWHGPGGSPPDLRSLAVTPAGTWLAAVHVGGLWRSADGGESWSAVVAPEADVHEVTAGADGLVAVAAAGGLAWSEDDGETWRWTTEGLHAPYARSVALDGATVYLTASTGPRSDDGRLYRGRLGSPLTPCTAGLPASFPFNLETGGLAARGGEVVLGTREGVLYRSADGGDTFEPVTERVPPVRVVRFA